MLYGYPLLYRYYTYIPITSRSRATGMGFSRKMRQAWRVTELANGKSTAFCATGTVMDTFEPSATVLYEQVYCCLCCSVCACVVYTYY